MVCDRAGIMSSWPLVQVPQIEQAVAIPTESLPALAQIWRGCLSPTSERVRQGIGFLARPTRFERVIAALRAQSFNGLMHRGKQHRHTITLSARGMDDEGTSSNALAVAGCALRDGLTNGGTSTFRWRCHNGRSIRHRKLITQRNDLSISSCTQTLLRRTASLISVGCHVHGSDGGTNC